MIGRVTTLMTAQTTLAEIDASQQRLADTQQQLSSGKRINQPSDDPYGMGVVLSLQGQLGALTAYDRNITDGTAYAQAGQTAMTNIANLVQRVRELAVSGANGSNSGSQLNAAASEVSELIDAVKQEANMTYNGQYIFSGTSGKQPYATATGDAFQGNGAGAGAVTRLIGPNTTVQVNVDLAAVLGSGQPGGAGDGKLLDTLRTVLQHMTSGNSGALGKDLTQIDTNFSSLTQLQASLGATSDRLQLASSRVSSLRLADTQVLSNTEDADMARTEINFSTEQVAYQAALKAGASIVQSSLMDFLK